MPLPRAPLPWVPLPGRPAPDGLPQTAPPGRPGSGLPRR